jgi:hypothetical protein
MKKFLWPVAALVVILGGVALVKNLQHMPDQLAADALPLALW